jgi:hypothetical protein
MWRDMPLGLSLTLKGFKTTPKDCLESPCDAALARSQVREMDRTPRTL